MKKARETSALSEDVQSHSRKDDSEHKIHREAVLYQPITSVELETLLSRVEQISAILRQNFLVVADLVDGRALHLPNLETLTVVLREVAQVLLEVNLLRLKSFETPSHLRRRNSDYRREMRIYLAGLSSLVEGLIGLPYTTFDPNPEVLDLLLLLRANLCALT